MFALAVFGCTLCLFGCFGIPQDPLVAANVNGEAIYEDDVTEYIEGFRAKNTDYETDSGWAEYLNSKGFTSETIRTYVLDTNFIPKALIKQECANRNIQVTDAELDYVIEQEKAYYESRYGEKSWDSVLASYGYDEGTWRENELNRLLEEQLADEVIADAEPTEGEIQAQANESAPNYSGKSSYYVSFPSEQEAQRALEQLNLQDETTTIEAFSALGEAVYAGWNSLNANRDSLAKEYIQALNSLELNHVSSPVQTGSTWVLIFCNSVFSASVGESVALGTIPAEIYEQIVADAVETKKERLFEDWLAAVKNDADIVYEPMPDGLPYSVNVSLVGE